MIGTTNWAKFAILLIPPMNTPPANTATTIPIIIGLSLPPVAATTLVAIEFDWTIFPTNPNAITIKIANATDITFANPGWVGPIPFLM